MNDLWADLVLMLHFAYVLFVVLGMAVIWMGFFFYWAFVRNFWFRLAHLLAIGIVVVESLMGVVCPLTEWENQMRLRAGSDLIYPNSFIAYWVHRVMFYDASALTFTIIYLLFFSVVLLSFWLVTPQWPKLWGGAPRKKSGSWAGRSKIGRRS
jgi:hypothetical protein